MIRYIGVLIFTLLLAVLPEVYAQKTSGATAIDPLRGKLDEARTLILNGNFPGASTMLQEIAAKNPQSGEALFLLGLAAIGIDKSKAGREKAGDYFLKSAQTGYCVPSGKWEKYPINQSNYIEANWNPAQKYMNEKDPQNFTTAINLLENIVAVDQKAHNASEHLGELYVKTGQNRKALDLFQRLLETNPDQSESIYNMGLGFFDIYNKDMAQVILADLSSEGPEKLTALAKLLMARAFFVVEDNRIASVYFFQSLDDLNEIAAREMYRDIIDIVNAKEKDEYNKARTIEQKKLFFRKFWKGRDPSPTTEYNERLVEHYRRLNYAKQNFFIKQTKGYDDRGIVYIKHGEPDQVAKLTGNFGIRDNESWLYRRKPDNYIFHFVRKTSSYLLVPHLLEAIVGSPFLTVMDQRPDPENPQETVTLTADDFGSNFRQLLMNRAELDPLYFRLAALRADFDDADYLQNEMITNFEMEESRLLEPGLTSGLATETYVPDMGAAPLEYYFYTADFMAMNTNSNLNIFYGLPISELEFKRDIIGVRVNYENTFAVFDQDWNEVKRVSNRRSYQMSQEPDRQNKGLLMVDKQNMNLPPGNYHFSVSVQDLGSNHLGIYKGDLDVTRYQVNEFNVSQIVLASNITPFEGDKPGKFTRGQYNVMPLPSRTFRQDQSVFVYYEIYFLTKGDEGKKRYNVDFTIQADKLDRNIASKIFSPLGKLISRSEDKSKITLTFDKEGDPEKIAQAEYVSIDISDSPAGLYNLTIVVTDTATGKKITRNTQFSIVRPS